MTTVVVNGVSRELHAPADTPLLYVLRNDLELTGPQFGCGMAQCGACSVLLNGKEVRSCITPLAAAAGKEVTTLEGLRPDGPAEETARRRSCQNTSPCPAGVDRRADPLCGFCQNGMMIKATELLEHTPSPTVAQIKDAFTSGVSPHLCRCGTYTAIIEAVQRAARKHGERRTHDHA